MNRIGAIRLSIVFAAVATVAVAVIIYAQMEAGDGQRRTSGCAQNLRMVGLGMAQYVLDYDTLPRAWYGKNAARPSANWADDVYPYTRGPAVFHCPAHEAGKPYHYPSTGANSGSYVFNNAYFAAGDKFTPPAGQPLSRITDATTVLVMDGENDFQFAWADPQHAPDFKAENSLRLGSIVARHRGTSGTVPMTLWADGSVHSNSLQSVAAEKVIHGQKIYTGFTIERD